jgi:hypothetical protein
VKNRDIFAIRKRNILMLRIMSTLRGFSLRRTKKRPHSPEAEEPSPSRLRKLDDHNATRFEEVFDNCLILEHMFQYMSVDDLRAMSQTNKQISCFILSWIQTTKAHATIFHSVKPDPNGGLKIGNDPTRRGFVIQSENWCQDFVCLSRLFKSLTCLQPISQRMRIGTEVIMQLQHVNPLPGPCLKMKPGQKDRTVSTGDCDWDLESNLLKSVAEFGYSLIKGWSQKNLDVAFDYLIANANNNYHIGVQLTVLWTDQDYVCGSNGVLEYRLRQQLLHLFWNEVPKSMQGMWLNKLVNTFCKDQVYQKSLLLYLMFGPMRNVNFDHLNDTLMWIMWDEPVSQMSFDEEFKPLAHALSILHDEKCLDYKVMAFLFRDPNDHDTHWTDQVCSANF